MITKEQACATVYGLMRKEGMIHFWQAEGRTDGVSAVFSAADMVSDKLAAVPVVITGMELAKQTPTAFPSLRRSALLLRWRPTGRLRRGRRMAEANGITHDHEKAALVGEHLEGGHGRRLVATLHAPRLQ